MRQIDPLIDPVPDQVFAGIDNVRPRAIGGRRAIEVRSDFAAEGTRVEPSTSMFPDWK
jgi:hypothetical protein